MKKVYIILITMFVLFSCWKNEDVLPVVDNTTVVEDNVVKNDSQVLDEDNSQDWNIGEFTSTVEDLIKKGWKVTCTMSTTQDWINMNWTMYIDWKKVKSSVTTLVDWKDIVMNTIILDDYTYSWDESTKMWTKFLNQDEDEIDDNNQDLENPWVEDDSNNDMDMWEVMNFSCKEWIPNDTFNIPSDIQFTEFNMDDMNDYMNGNIPE